MGGEFMILLSNYLTSSYPDIRPHVLIFSHILEFRAIDVSSPVILAFFYPATSGSVHSCSHFWV
jgi:hypothetical protein